jgi:hypothetical protein
LTLTQLNPPIVAATVLNVFLFAAAWRAGQIEGKAGHAPWWLFPGMVLYGLPLLVGLYLIGDTPVATYPKVFAAAAASEALAVGVVYAILNAFLFTRGQPVEHRAGPFVAATFFVALLIATAFY